MRGNSKPEFSILKIYAKAGTGIPLLFVFLLSFLNWKPSISLLFFPTIQFFSRGLPLAVVFSQGIKVAFENNAHLVTFHPRR